MYEKKKQRPLSRARFIRRFVAHLSIAIALLAISLAIGMSGYEYFEDLPWRNAFLNSAMLLGGMGPVDPVKTDGGKLFAGIYALYAGLVFIVTAALVFTPILYRVLHKFHWDDNL